MFILVINSVLAIFATKEPWFIPVLAALIGIGLFLSSIFVLLTYIRDIADFITPESMIDEIFNKFPIQTLRAEAREKLLPKSIHDVTDFEKLAKIRIVTPSISGIPEQFGDGMRILIDISRRMIQQADHSVVQKILDRLTNYSYNYMDSYQSLFYDTRDLGANEPDNNHNYEFDEDFVRNELTAYGVEADPVPTLHLSFDDDKVEQKITEINELRKNLDEAAFLAYIAGGLLQIWSACVWSDNKLTALGVINAYKRLFDGKIFEDEIYLTDLLKTVFTQKIFTDTSRPGWQQLRPAVIDIFSDNYDFDYRKKRYPVGGIEFRKATANFYDFYHELLKKLVAENPVDTVSLQIVMEGIDRLMVYAASVGSATIGDFSFMLWFYLPKRVEIDHRSIANTIQRVGKLWTTAAKSKDVYSKAYSKLMSGLRSFFNQRLMALKDLESEELLSGYANPFLDSLEFVTVECVKTNQPRILAETLTEMYQIGFYLFPEPWYAIACIDVCLGEAVKKKNITLVTTWLEVSERNINLLSPLSKRAFNRLTGSLKSVTSEIQDLYRAKNLDDMPLKSFIVKLRDLNLQTTDDVSKDIEMVKIKDWHSR